MSNKKNTEIEVTHCGNCPASDGEFDTCQINGIDKSLVPYGELPKKCPLRKSNITLKLKP